VALGLGQGIVRSNYAEAAAEAMMAAFTTRGGHAAVYAAALDSIVEADDQQCANIVAFLKRTHDISLVGPETTCLQRMHAYVAPSAIMGMWHQHMYLQLSRPDMLVAIECPDVALPCEHQS
jgi:hypothetical protein